MKPPLGFIMARKVGKKELYKIFNEPTFRADLMKRTNQRIDVSANPASPECNQEPGTMSYVYDWMEYVGGRAQLLATVHMFKKSDGSIGASGQPDPVVVVVNGTPLTDP